jgi:hypothetical protein
LVFFFVFLTSSFSFFLPSFHAQRLFLRRTFIVPARPLLAQEKSPKGGGKDTKDKDKEKKEKKATPKARAAVKKTPAELLKEMTPEQIEKLGKAKPKRPHLIDMLFQDKDFGVGQSFARRSWKGDSQSYWTISRVRITSLV